MVRGNDTMDSHERHNLAEIAGLSQRGETLSIIDLIAANTLSVEMAAVGLYTMALGASVLTAAMPGNAGKTTLLACLLTGIPPDATIVTIRDPSVLDQLERRVPKGEVMLIHEIGSGPWYAYLWGRDVARAVGMIQPGRALASCIHADTLEQLRGILTSPTLDVPPDQLSRIDLLYFMHLERRGWRYRRRVAAMYEAFGEAKEHRPLFRWDPAEDTFSRTPDAEAFYERLARKAGIPVSGVHRTLERTQALLRELLDEDVRDFREVRARWVALMLEG